MGHKFHFYSYVDPVRSMYNIGPCCHVIAQIVFWVELPVQRGFFPIFVKSWVSEKGDSKAVYRRLSNAFD